MPTGTRHKALVFLVFMLLALGLVGCGDTPEPDTAPVTEVAQTGTTTPAPTPTPILTSVPTPTPVPLVYTRIPSTAVPTPDYLATVEARLVEERAKQTVIEAKVEATVKAMGEANVHPTLTPTLTSTPIATPTPTPTPIPTPTPTSIPLATPTPSPRVTQTPTLSEIAETLRPSVVRINRPGFESGTGFIISSTGLILTNAHLVANVGVVDVELSTGVVEIGVVLERDKPRNLALLKINGYRLPAAELNFTQTPKVGDKIFTMGYSAPEGAATLTEGRVNVLQPNAFGSLTGLRRDSVLSPRNAGGPLVDLTGKVVGVNHSGSVGCDRCGGTDSQFSIVITEALNISDLLKKETSLTPGWFVNETYPYTIVVPDGWNAYELHTSYVLLRHDQSGAQIYIKVEAMQPDVTTDEFLDSRDEDHISARVAMREMTLLKTDKIEMNENISSREFTLSTLPSREIIDTWKIHGRDFYNIGSTFSSSWGGYAYDLIVNSPAPQWGIVKPVIDQIIASFTLDLSAPLATPDTRDRIVFGAYGENNYDIWVMNADGSEQTQLTSGSVYENHPAWSPDRRKIAFVREGEEMVGAKYVWVMNADGSEQTQLTSGLVADDTPDWSPDGEKIVFVRSEGRQNDIWVMNADGSEQTQLTKSSSGGDFQPAWAFIKGGKIASWSAKGGQIVFMRDAPNSMDIWVTNTDGSNQTHLTRGLFLSDPAWSPDAEKIAFNTGIRDGGTGNVYIMNADSFISISRTGSNGFRGWDAMHDELATVTFQLTKGPLGGGSPAWSPDGEKIAYLNNSDVWVMNADGSGSTTQLTKDPNRPGSLDW